MSLKKYNIKNNEDQEFNSFLEFKRNKPPKLLLNRNKKLTLLQLHKNPFNLTFQSFQKNHTAYSQSNTIETNYSYHKDFNNTVSKFNYNIYLEPIISIDEKLHKAAKKYKVISQKKKKYVIEKLFNKEKNLEKVKANLHKTRLKILAQNNKIDDMKRLKLKLHNLLTKESNNLCEDFELKNTLFNTRILDFLSSNNNLKQSLLFHSKFRFDKSENGEGHNREKMLVDIDSMKKNEDNSSNFITQHLSKYEKKLIRDDPRYFFQSNLKSFVFKPLTLTQRIQKEENGIYDFKKIDDFDFEKLNMCKDEGVKKKKKQKVNHKIKNDIEKQLNEIHSNLNKEIYLDRTNFLDLLNKKKVDEREKIIDEMNNRIRLNNILLLKDQKKIDFRKRVFTFRETQNLLSTNNSSEILSHENQQTSNFGHNYNLKNFNPEDVEFINRCKDKIKKNFDQIYYKGQVKTNTK